MSAPTCRTCWASIVWARTGSGKAIPLDLEPTEAGNVELVDGVAKVWGTAHVWPEGAVRFMPHHATCPNWSK